MQQFIITWKCNGAGLKSLTDHRCPPMANNDNFDLLTVAYKINTKLINQCSVSVGRSTPSKTIRQTISG
jgi:hypothetical protein